MSLSRPQSNAHYRLIVGLFKIAVAAAHKLGYFDADALTRAFEQAQLEVLFQSSRAEQAFKLGRTKKTIHNMARRVREPLEPGALRRLLRDLEHRPLSTEEIQSRLPWSGDYDLDAIAIPMLLRDGTLVKLADGRYTLGKTLTFPTEEDARWDGQIEQVQCQIRIMACLASGALTEKELALEVFSSQERDANTVLLAALAALEQKGMIRSRPDATLKGRVWVQIPAAHALVDPEPVVRHLTGLIDMVTLLQELLPESIGAQAREDFAQRNFRFYASPQALIRFIQRHRQEVKQALEQLEKQAQDAPEGIRFYGFSWLLMQLPPAKPDR